MYRSEGKSNKVRGSENELKQNEQLTYFSYIMMNEVNEKPAFKHIHTFIVRIMLLLMGDSKEMEFLQFIFFSVFFSLLAIVPLSLLLGAPLNWHRQ